MNLTTRIAGAVCCGNVIVDGVALIAGIPLSGANGALSLAIGCIFLTLLLTDRRAS